MATKKAASTTKKKTTAKKPVARSTTKVTTVKTDRSAVVAAEARHKRLTARSGRNYTQLAAAAVAELVGTFILAAIVLSQSGQPVPVLFGIMAAVLATSALSGAYLNPALTVGAWVTRKIDGVRALFYIVGEILGGMLALIVVNSFVTGAATELSAQAKMLGQSAPEVFKAAAVPAGKEWLVLFAELLGTVIFAFVVASAVSEKRKSLNAAISVGTGLFAALLIAGSATGSLVSQGAGLTFLNPAVAIASQVLASNVVSVWGVVIYLIMPLVGGAIGFGAYELLKVGRTRNAE